MRSLSFFSSTHSFWLSISPPKPLNVALLMIRFHHGLRMCAAAVLLQIALALPLVAVEKEILQPIQTDYSVSDPQFRQSINHLLGPPLVDGNKIKTLINGDEIFPAMLNAIRHAEKSITFETYIWSKGKVGEEFAHAISERAMAGVKCHVIVDTLGSMKLPRKLINEMRASGVRFVKYGHPNWWNFFFFLNHRDHRKILVVDGKVGFTGGVGIHDNWDGNAEAPPLWRDTHFKIEGPAVAQLQGVFVDNWVRERNRVLQGSDYFPPMEPAGKSAVQCFRSGPRDGAENARLDYLMSIAAARKSIRFEHAYFVPDKLITRALVDACKRGVKIEVIIPGPTDSEITKVAGHIRWKELLRAGVKFYEYQQAQYHCKEMIVDDIWVTAGSVNLDHRSFRINAENNFNILDKDFAAEQIRIFEQDKAQSRLLTLKDLRWGFFGKIYECFAGCFRSQL
ncbi:MAG: cls [Verrucomicrobiales bacterium]|nr:cls [Verrucomicrobiales bacterium]